MHELQAVYDYFKPQIYILKDLSHVSLITPLSAWNSAVERLALLHSRMTPSSTLWLDMWYLARDVCRHFPKSFEVNIRTVL
jgi:hypothetical protein